MKITQVVRLFAVVILLLAEPDYVLGDYDESNDDDGVNDLRVRDDNPEGSREETPALVPWRSKRDSCEEPSNTEDGSGSDDYQNDAPVVHLPNSPAQDQPLTDVQGNIPSAVSSQTNKNYGRFGKKNKKPKKLKTKRPKKIKTPKPKKLTPKKPKKPKTKKHKTRKPKKTKTKQPRKKTNYRRKYKPSRRRG